MQMKQALKLHRRSHQRWFVNAADLTITLMEQSDGAESQDNPPIPNFNKVVHLLSPELFSAWTSGKPFDPLKHLKILLRPPLASLRNKL
jgi:hypothetical protein